MKYRLIVLCMALAVLLSGCRFLPDSYVSVSPHADSYPQQTEEALTVEDYTELKNALLALVEEGVEEAELTTGAYSGDIEQDYATAVAYITGINPMGAYVVDSIDKEIIRAGTYYKLNLKIRYRRSHAELAKAMTVRGSIGTRNAVAAAVAESSERLLLRISGYDQMDFDAMVAELSAQDITRVMAKPTVSAEVVPNSGSVRIVELDFTYPRDPAELRVMQSAVNTIMNSAYGYVRFVKSDLERAILLYSFLTERHDYIVQSSETPAYALLCEGIADSRAFAEVFGVMCNRSMVKCTVVHGMKNGEPYEWNILELESGTWHVDVLADEQAGMREPSLRTDAEMGGYSWDTQAYPVCSGPVVPAEPQENGQTDVQNPAETPEAGANGGQTPTEQEDAESEPPSENPGSDLPPAPLEPELPPEENLPEPEISP